MAIVEISPVYSFEAGPGNERTLPTPDASNWNVGILQSTNIAELLSTLDPAQPSRDLYAVYGTNLFLEGGDFATNAAGDGLPLLDRAASGTINRILYQHQVDGSLQTHVQFLNLNISFVDLLAHASNITEYLLSGHDQITATELSYDLVHGYGGNDTITAGDGADSIFGDAGNDILLPGRSGVFPFESADQVDGGTGTDTVSFVGLRTAVQVNLATGIASGPADPYGIATVNATLVSVENIVGGNAGDVLIGHNGANRISGGTGDDQIHGLSGNDALFGDAGNDAIHGNDGNDRLFGSIGNDGLFGDAGNDVLHGGAGYDQISGGDGDDVINGDAGHDRIFAESGNDTVSLGVGNDGFTLGLGDDTVLASVNCGRDTIFDFGNGNDVLNFLNTVLTLQTLQNSTVETAAGVLITLGTGSLLLAGLEMTDLNWNTDFVFAA